MLMSGLLGQMRMRSLREWLRDAWGGMRGFHTGKANSFHDRFGAALDEIFLKMEWAFV